MSARRARVTTNAPSASSGLRARTSWPHWPGEIHAPKQDRREHHAEVGRVRQMLPRGRMMDFEKIAAHAAAGCTEIVGTHQSSVRLSAVDNRACDRRRGASVGIGNERMSAAIAAAKVRIICAVETLKIAQPRAASEQDSEEHDLENPRIAECDRKLPVIETLEGGDSSRIGVHGLSTYERRA